MTLNLPLSYFVWTKEYCQTSRNKKKSPNLWHVTSILVCCIFGTKFSSKFFIFLCAGLNSWVQAWIWLTDQQDYGLKSLLTNRYVTNIAIKSYYTRLRNWHRFYVFQFSIFFQAQMPNFCLFSALHPNPEFRVVENVIITAINLVTFSWYSSNKKFPKFLHGPSVLCFQVR